MVHRRRGQCRDRKGKHCRWRRGRSAKGREPSSEPGIKRKIFTIRFSDPLHRPARHASVRVTGMTGRGHGDAGDPLSGGNQGTGRRQAFWRTAGPAGADVASAVQ